MPACLILLRFTFLVDGTQTIDPDYYGNYYYTFTTTGEHTITLTNHFGGCDESITKKVEVKGLLHPKGFVTKMGSECTQPIPVNFTDTTVGVVKAEWNFNHFSYPLAIEATGKSVSHSFTEGTYTVTLFETDSNGCRNDIEQQVTTALPHVYLQWTDNNGNTACDSLTKKFQMTTSEDLTSFTWDFGDSTTSNDTLPVHTYGVGTYTPKIEFTTAEGCTGYQYGPDVSIGRRDKAHFISKSGTEICGNSPVIFEGNNNGYFNFWYVNGNFIEASGDPAIYYQFRDTGKYTITEDAYNQGCWDTLTQVDYIHVSPSFPRISNVINSCDGDHGIVTFSQDSKYATTWKWDFGDGSNVSYDTNQTQLQHHYTKTGVYETLLTTTNGACVNRDSITTYVLLKQHPVLASSDTNLCDDEVLNYTISNLQLQTNPNIWAYYYVDTYEYNDGTSFAAGGYSNMDNWIYQLPYKGIFKNLQKGKDSLRIITREALYDCLDTTNFIPIKIHGAVAGFETLTDNICFHLPFSFKDTSSAVNTTITSRQWNFGDGKTLTTTSAGIVTHTYENPGTYYVTLNVSDASGCTSTTSTLRIW